MSSPRPLVDLLDEGDSFTYALVALSGLGQAVRSVADSAPHLHLVDDPDTNGPESEPGDETDSEMFDHLLLGLAALGAGIDRLMPVAPPAGRARDNDGPLVRPHELLR